MKIELRKEWMDGRKDRRIGGRTDGQTVGWTDTVTDGQMGEHIDEWTDGQTDRWIDK